MRRKLVENIALHSKLCYTRENGKPTIASTQSLEKSLFSITKKMIFGSIFFLVQLIVFRTFVVFSCWYATISHFTIYRLWHLSFPSQIFVSTDDIHWAVCRLHNFNIYSIELFYNAVCTVDSMVKCHHFYSLNTTEIINLKAVWKWIRGNIFFNSFAIFSMADWNNLWLNIAWKSKA